MNDNWTTEQLEAIEKEGDLIVSAAAGAGKTSVLTERIARLIAKGADVERLLVVTFTNAAAAEMKQRIEARLIKLADDAAAAGLDERAAKLKSASASCARANISTLHSFCMSVLRRNYHEAGLDPAFGVAETLDAELLAAKAVDDVLEERFAANEKTEDPALKALVSAVKTDEKLAGLIRSLYAFAIARPDPDAWLDMAVSMYTDDFPSAAARIADGLIARSRADTEFFFAEAKRLIGDLSATQPTAAAALGSDRDVMMGLLLQPDYDHWVSAVNGIGKLDVLRFKNGTDDAEKQEAKNYREAFKAFIATLKKRFAHTLDEESAYAKLLAPPIRLLRELVGDFTKRFAELKEDEGVIDFSDMEQLTLKVLSNPAVAAEYREKFLYIFVDEYQDINPAQEAILERISKGNRFMVGDVKQSIYRFRQAEPAIFLEKYRTYKEGEGRSRVDLNANFRSRTAVLDAANLLFSQLMKGENVGEIDYSDNARLVSGRDPVPGEDHGSVEMVLIDPALGLDDADLTPDDDDSESAERTNAGLMAAYSAGRILDLMEHGTVSDKDGPRRYRWSDFAVLMRSAKGEVSDWMETFSNAGIPCVSDRGEGFYAAIEVRIFTDLLRVIDNRRQDIPLLAVMRSPIFGFTEEELIHIRADYDGEEFLDCVLNAAKDPAAPSWSIKCAGMLAKIDRWRARAKLTELGTLVTEVLDETRFEVNVSALYGGEARERNLETLLSLAQRLSSSGGTLSDFIRFLDEASGSAKEPGQVPSSADAVRLMTVHSSKGLEFPVVILANITKKFFRGYRSDVGIFDAELGIGLCSVAGDRELKSMLQRAIAAREARRLNAEEMRLLYVAQTRAKEKLIMLGVKKDAEKFAAKYSARLDDVRIMNAEFYANWMLGAYFPQGPGSELSFPHGGGMKLDIIPPVSNAGDRGSMTSDAFGEWLQEASFLDTSALDKRFSEQYPALTETRLPSKLSVTGLTKARAQVALLPRFMEDEREFSAAEAGTLAHRLLQLVSLKPHTEASVREELELFTARGQFTEREADAINTEHVVRFFSSELGRRLLASPRIEREKEFDVYIDADKLTDTGSKAPIMLQGVIDCCFIEDGAWVLVDHKTTHIDKTHTANTVARRYARQLELYADALEKLTGLPVKEKYVYLLSVDEAVKL